METGRRRGLWATHPASSVDAKCQRSLLQMTKDAPVMTRPKMVIIEQHGDVQKAGDISGNLDNVRSKNDTKTEIHAVLNGPTDGRW